MSRARAFAGSLESTLQVDGVAYRIAIDNVYYYTPTPRTNVAFEKTTGWFESARFQSTDAVGFVDHPGEYSLAEVVAAAEDFTHISLTFSVRDEISMVVIRKEYMPLPLEVILHIKDFVASMLARFSITSVSVDDTLGVSVILERGG
jgi:hypothetical protein